MFAKVLHDLNVIRYKPSEQLFTRHCGRNKIKYSIGFDSFDTMEPVYIIHSTQEKTPKMAQESRTQVQLSQKFSSAEQDDWSANRSTLISQRIRNNWLIVDRCRNEKTKVCSSSRHEDSLQILIKKENIYDHPYLKNIEYLNPNKKLTKSEKVNKIRITNDGQVTIRLQCSQNHLQVWLLEQLRL